MRVEYINPFADSAVEILSTIGVKDIKRGEVYIKTSAVKSMMGVTLIVGLAGQVRGRIIINMDKDTGLKIASIMNSETMTQYNEMSSATLTELANMIVGTAVTKLHDKGYKFDITPPAMVMGDNIKLSDRELDSLILPLSTSEGNIEINVAIKEEIL